MQTTQHSIRCQVYLHPAAASNPKAIAAIQSQTGLIVITHPKFCALKAIAAPKAVDDLGPWGGDAA
ncbi:hypothetical protein [Pseudomonas viridiflava]|uniref:hypothetical protein n=1 Tax=Pseudomonas viridiflava TaxID=33069 RepID=UPI000F01743A|nr:hypothetical protein [Pseudomonas viridiflava]